MSTSQKDIQIINTSTNMTLPLRSIVPASTVITTISSLNPISQNGSYWIRINPVNDTTRGDQLVVTGSTSLPADIPLTVELYYWFPSPTKCSWNTYYSAPIRIESGSDPINTFSSQIDTTGDFPDEAIITVLSSENRSISDDVFLTISNNATPLMLPDDAAMMNISKEISVGFLPLHDVKRGDVQSIYVFGNTSNLISTHSHTMLFSVYNIPEKREIISGASDSIDSRQNLTWFISRFNTSDFETGQYMVNISFVCSDQTTSGLFNVT
jgi:hypothetical protein